MLSLKSNYIEVIINWKNTDTFNKVRLINYQGLYIWQLKQKINNKWVLTNQLFENYINDIPQKRNSQIVRMINRGITPKTIVYVINKIYGRNLCGKGITINNVYKIIRPLRKSRYSKIEINNSELINGGQM